MGTLTFHESKMLEAFFNFKEQVSLSYFLSLQFDFGPVRLQRHTQKVLLQGLVIPACFTQRRGFQTVSLEQTKQKLCD